MYIHFSVHYEILVIKYHNSITTNAGSLGSSIFDKETYLVGASGGSYALVGAHFAIVIMVLFSNRLYRYIIYYIDILYIILIYYILYFI